MSHGSCVLGIRCYPDKVAAVILSGTQGNPTLERLEIKTFPVDRSPAGQLAWVFEELDELLRDAKPGAASYKKVEGMAVKNKSTLQRAEVEGVVKAALSKNGLEPRGFIKSQLKSETNYGGDTKNVAEVLSTTAIRDLLGTDAEEAALVAFATLKAT